MADSELRTYLNDHLAGSINAIELARHAAGERSGTELGAFLAGLADEIEADRNALLEVMESLGASVDHPKQVLAWGLEKAMRLKYHSPLSSRGPLTTMLELETLLLGIVGKLSLWRAL